MAGIDWNVVSTMTPYQQKVIGNAANLSANQRSDAQKAAMDAYRRVLAQQGTTMTVTNPGTGSPNNATPPISAGGGGGTGGGGTGNKRPSWLYGDSGGGGIANIDSMIQDPAKLSYLFSQAGLQGDLQAQLQAAMLGYGAAGANQWNSNLAGAAAGAFPNQPGAQQNVGLDTDINALRRMVGEISGMLQRGENPSSIYSARQGMVNPIEAKVFPEMVGPDIYNQLLSTAGGQTYGRGTPYEGRNEANTLPEGANAGRGLRWLPQLFADPGINKTDPNAPLFDPAHPPASLSQLHGFQAGESAMLSGLSYEDALRQLLGPTYDYFHRPAGTAASGPGPMFGDVWYNDAASGSFIDQQGNTTPLTQRGYLTETPQYALWSAFGQPSRASDGTVHGSYGDSINLLTGAGSPGQGQPGNGFAQALLSGQVNPGMFAEYNWNPNASWEDSPYFVENMILPALGRIGTSAFLANPQYYIDSHPAAGTATPEALSRLLALLAQSQVQVPVEGE